MARPGRGRRRAGTGADTPPDRPFVRCVRQRGAVLVVAVMAAVAAMVPPRRFVVDGPSMTPGLRSGDIVSTGLLPLRDRLTAPRRFDRWVLAAADGTPVIKRVVGLPGETVSIDTGDLVVDGRTPLKGPRLLARMGSRVAGEWHADANHADPGTASGQLWQGPAGAVLDDDPQATGGIPLLPVRDVGCAAVVLVPRRPGTAVLRVRARVAETIVTWRLAAAGRYAIVAGRLDGHLVAVAWRLPAGRGGACPDRSCLPDGPPDRWSCARPWPIRDGTAMAPALAIELDAAAAVREAGASIETAWRWRDVLYRAAADGAAAWPIDPGAIFVLGDFPAGSRDSRHWGPLPITALRQRIAGDCPTVPQGTAAR